jgi:thiamine biosynthesis lipoprotein
LRKIYSKIVIAVLTVSMIAGLTSCGGQKRYEAEFLMLFDTVTRIIGYSDSKESFTEDVQFIYDNMKIYHELYDIYNDYDFNNIKTINDKAGVEPVAVDRKIIDLLLFSKEVCASTGGKVNVAMGPVLGIWHDYRETGVNDPARASLPPMELLLEAAKHTDIDKVIIDEENSTVYLADPEMSLDVGAVAKGYAVEMVARLAQKHGIKNMIISAGGNVCAIGDRGDERGNWVVGVQNPDTESSQKHLLLLSVNDMSLITSGSYERYYTVEGIRYGHIIDPDTLMPATHYESVTVLVDDSGWGDAYSTAVFCLPFEESLAFVEARDGVEALWVFSDGTIEYSSGIKSYIKE